MSMTSYRVRMAAVSKVQLLKKKQNLQAFDSNSSDFQIMSHAHHTMVAAHNLFLVHTLLTALSQAHPSLILRSTLAVCSRILSLCTDS